MTGSHSHHSTDFTSILRDLIAQAQPMIAAEGGTIPNTGFLKTKLHNSKIGHIIQGVEVITHTFTPKMGVINFTFEGKRFTAKVGHCTTGNRQQDNRLFILTWDHSTACDFLTASDLWEGAA